MRILFALFCFANSFFMLRYCDKNRYSRCCNERGIQKTEEWENYFVTENINISHIYASSNNKNTCHIKFKMNERCQYSNRTYALTRVLRNVHKINTIHISYCLGEEAELVRHIKDNDENVVVMWEHSLYLTFRI
jgi:hypothetical protein